MAHSTPATPPSTFNLLSSLPLTHPALLDLVLAHKPFVRPSTLPHSAATKFLARVNTSVVGRDASDAEKRAALTIAGEAVRQDTEGWVLSGWGKGWVGTTTGAISSAHTPLSAIPLHVDLVLALINASSTFPAFERESVHPILGKLSVNLVKLLERALSEPLRDWLVVIHLVNALAALLAHSPPTCRPVLPTLKPILNPLALAPTHAIPHSVRDAAGNLWAKLHQAAGKAQAPQVWAMDMREALSGARNAFAAIAADGWHDVQQTEGLHGYPADSAERLPLALSALEGWTELILSMLRLGTARPVPVPIGQILLFALRCLDQTLDGAVVEYITPQHHAALIGILPRIWTVGILLVGAVASACGDNVLPHLSDIFDHTVYLSETLPGSMTQTQVQLIRLHRHLLRLFPAALLPVTYPTRLLKSSLSKLSALLDSRTTAPPASGLSNGAKKGKKRARGEEDSVVGGLEGREARKIGVEASIAAEVLGLTPLLHVTPLLSPSLLTLSIRVHLALHLALPQIPRSRFVDAATPETLRAALQSALEEACLTGGDSGHARGWRTTIIAALRPTAGRLQHLLHPSVPPLIRPAPPLSALHFFAAEGEDERKIRRELGLGHLSDGVDAAEEAEEGARDRDGNVNAAPPAQRARVDTLVVPVASNDIRAGKNDVHSSAPTHGSTSHGVVRILQPAAASASGSAPAVKTPEPAVVPVDTTPGNDMDIDETQAGDAAVVEVAASGFMSTPAARADGSGSAIGGREAATKSSFVAVESAAIGEEEAEEDEAIPELDSENSDFEDDDEDGDEAD